jgi:tagaturonate epimerase
MSDASISTPLAQQLAQAIKAELYPASVIQQDRLIYSLVRTGEEKHLAIFAPETSEIDPQFEGESGAVDVEEGWRYRLCPRTPGNANALRQRLPWLRPVPLGTRTSFGFGDRTGLATPGHVQSVRGTGIAPIFAQQSVRENTRIGRTPQQVMDDAMWGVFEEGWQDDWGADADHVKEVASLADFVAAGYTFFTIDPSDHVDNAAHTDDLSTLRQKVDALPAGALEATTADFRHLYMEKTFFLGGLTLAFNEERLLRAAAKYGRAIAHARAIATSLIAQMEGRPFELEFSVDETDTPTSPFEHFFIASELHRLEIPVVSLAPRFIGKFEKGVDYMGDLDQFAEALEQDVAIMRHFGSYKLSIHTGSDKFSIYPLAAKAADGMVHVKTAGTSYLEALRVIALEDPDFFRTILDFSRSHFETDRKSYYLSCDAGKVSAAETYTDEELPDLLNQFDSRQVLHVTFGSVLDHYGDRIKQFIRDHEDEYIAVLVSHFGRHLEPFVRSA